MHLEPLDPIEVVAVALRRAQLEILARRRSAGEPAAPWAWGGFIVLGPP